MAQKHALEWKLRINDGYSTMSDGITSSGGGGGPLALWLMCAFTLTLCYQVGGLFLLNYYNNMAMSFVTKLNFWGRKRYRIRLDSFFYIVILIHGNDKHDRLLVQLVLNGLEEAPCSTS